MYFHARRNVGISSWLFVVDFWNAIVSIWFYRLNTEECIGIIWVRFNNISDSVSLVGNINVEDMKSCLRIVKISSYNYLLSFFNRSAIAIRLELYNSSKKSINNFYNRMCFGVVYACQYRHQFNTQTSMVQMFIN